MPRRSLIGLLALVALLSVGSPIAAQETLDPQSLVGKWEGKWRDLSSGGPTAGTSGPYAITITEAGDKGVFGTYHSTFRGRDNEAPFRGTLQGNRLTFGTVELTVLGAKMEGAWRGPQARWGIELQKK